MSFETLDQTGFKFEATAVEFAQLSANFGGGYEATSLIGLASGLREWNIRIAALPDMAEHTIETVAYGIQTRADYLWDFYVRQQAAGNKSFWLVDVREELKYLVKFVETKLTYEVFTATLYAASLRLRERRERGVTSPVSV